MSVLCDIRVGSKIHLSNCVVKNADGGRTASSDGGHNSRARAFGERAIRGAC